MTFEQRLKAMKAAVKKAIPVDTWWHWTDGNIDVFDMQAILELYGRVLTEAGYDRERVVVEASARLLGDSGLLSLQLWIADYDDDSLRHPLPHPNSVIDYDAFCAELALQMATYLIDWHYEPKGETA